MKEELKLYRITLRGGLYSPRYVIAKNTDQAYQKVRKRLDEKDIGFVKDRELDKIELIATDYEYNDTGTVLYL